MDICILDDHYELVQVIDQFESFCWTVRYNEVGQFELQAIADITILSYVQKGLYVKIKDSDRLMLIDTIEYKSDVENGDHLTASGESLERILKWRVILNEITLDGSLQEGILRILNENVIDPEDKKRTYPIVTFKQSEDPIITALEAHITFQGETVYDAIEALCKANNIGFRMLPDYENYGYIFELYAGVDRSYNQTALPQVVFSPEYENLINSSYVDSDNSMTNLVYVVNENSGIIMEVYAGLKFDFETDYDPDNIAEPPEGRARREQYTSSSVSVPEVTPYGPPESYIDRRDTGDWVTTFDEDAYNKAVADARQRARDQIAAAGGTEADISWPPAGREGQSYEDYCALHVPKWAYTKEEYVENSNWQPAVLSAEEQAEQKFNQAMADPTTYAKYEMRDEGLVNLLDNRTLKTFDGEIVNYFQFVANRDYFLGDVVQMVNGLFVSVPTRFTEVSFCYDESGMSVVPTFTTDVDIDPKEEI